jgi:sulfite reductase (NADPH) flavoprotein alpha-component
MNIPFLPESAPFSVEQRAWLNGFLAGVMSNQNGASNGNASSSGVATASTVEAPVESEEDFPWHDSTLPIEERMKLAKDKPKPLQLMAAMAQLDCGSCGYVCKTYAQAIADGSEKSLSKCTPGGKETSQKLKKIMAA